ncbi:MAG TPA: inorganic pyrophosphatase [Anaerolineae bacterium]|nr:inorganic pyrophosphatase [Anaerolineae bacterium]
MQADELFWTSLDRLVAEGQVVVDRPRGSAHPRYPALVYPLDYGYLAGTVAADGDGVDVWRGTRHGAGVTGVVCTVDLGKRDVELKILLECTADEARRIVDMHREGQQSAILLERPAGQEEQA